MIASYLEKKKIKFNREYKFKDLKDKTYLRFDFAILGNNEEVIGLIEC